MKVNNIKQKVYNILQTKFITQYNCCRLHCVGTIGSNEYTVNVKQHTK